MKMEVNKELISYIKASELPKVGNPVSGDLIHAQGNNLSTTPISYFIDKISSGIYGRLTTSTVVPGIGYYKYDVAQAGTYTNISPAITITQQELDENFVFVTVNNGVAEKLLSKKPNSKVETWSAKSYEKGSQVFYEGAIYEAVVGTQSTDIPGEAPETVWMLKVQGALIRSGKKTLVQLLDATGNQIAKWDDNGNFVTNYDANIIPVSAVKGLEYFFKDTDYALKELKNALSFKYTNERGFYRDAQLDTNLRSDIVDFTDSELKKYIYVDENGEVFISKLRVGKLRDSEKDHAAKYEIFDGTELAVPEQTMLYLDILQGPLPIDSGPSRTPTQQICELRDAKGKKIGVFNTEMSIQGQYTAGLMKPGYSIDLFNDKGKAVTLKIGDRPPLKGFHLKAYLTDFTHTRDVGGGLLWQTFIRSNKYPYNHFKAIYAKKSPNTLDYEGFSSDAQYALIGVPCEVRVAGRFQGLYVLRTKKTDSIYAINSKRDTCIFIESQAELAAPVGIPVGLGSYDYKNFEEVAMAYEIRSPKTKNITANTKTNTMRFFKWCRDIFTGALDAAAVRASYADYINLPHWLDWIIIAEFLLHWDTISNNAGYISYDGLHFSPILIDMDLTIDVDKTKQHTVNQLIITADIFPKLRTIFLPELKARYTELRKSGVLSNEAVRKIYGGISRGIPWSVYEAEFKKWNTPGWWWWNNFVPSMDLLYDTCKYRLDFLDSQWLNP